jgi:signal peptidase I
MIHSLHIDLLRELLERDEPVELRVEGRSMQPLLEEGSQVVVERVARDGVAAGDILSYWDGERIISHVFHFALPLGGRRFLFLKGVANRHGDLPVAWESVLGRVTRAGDTARPSGRAGWSLLPWAYLVGYGLRRCKQVVRKTAHISLKGLFA